MDEAGAKHRDATGHDILDRLWAARIGYSNWMPERCANSTPARCSLTNGRHRFRRFLPIDERMANRLTRRKWIAAIGAAMLPRPLNAQRSLTPMIGLLDSVTATALKTSAFYDGLKVEGFFRNQNLTVEYHSAAGDYGRLPELAADLIARGVTLITAFGTPAARAAKSATTKIPVIFAISANPIKVGLVASLDHPGANMTGVAGMAAGREQKRLELLHAVAPTAAVLGFLLNPQNSNEDAQTADVLAAAQKIGVQIKLVRASATRDFGDVFAGLAQSRAGGLVIVDDEFLLSAGAELGFLAAQHGIPAIFQGAAFTAAGGLMSYGTKLAELYHQAGAYSGLILAGANPMGLPVYQSGAIELIVNLRSAKLFGLAVPQTIIDQANTLIR
jgi:putative ABC transport system substrate-binding protein